MMHKSGVLHELNRRRTLYIMALPAIVITLVFCYIPMVGIIVAFKNYNYDGGFFFSPWAGLDNFKFFFISGKAWLVTRNTILYNLAFIIVDNVFEILIAIIITELYGKYYKKITQSIMFFPHFISWVIVGAFVYNIFNYEYGLLNTLLKSLNAEPLNIYNMPWAWKYILVGFSVWKSVGYGSIIYIAAIMGLDTECYESARIDGADVFQKIRYIILPLLVPTIIIVLLLSLGSLLRGNFQMFYQLVGTSGNLYNATDVIDTFVFRSLIQSNDLGMASAAGFYQSTLCLVIILVVNYIVKKFETEYALF